MARLTKSGEPPLQKLAVEYMAKMNRAFARELSDIVSSALTIIPARPQEDATADDLWNFAAEVLDCHAELLKTLTAAAHRHGRLDEALMLVHGQIRRGRPAGSKPPARPKPRAQGLLTIFPLQKKGGRPTELGPDFDDEIYQAVVAKRRELSASGRPATIKAALQSIFEGLAREGVRPSRLERDYSSRFRAAYGRGKKRAEGGA